MLLWVVFPTHNDTDWATVLHKKAVVLLSVLGIRMCPARLSLLPGQSQGLPQPPDPLELL